MKRKVAVIFGGRSAEHEVSCVSARSVVDALDPDRFDVVPIGVDKTGAWHLLTEVPKLPQVEPGQRPVLPSIGAEAGPTVALGHQPGSRSLVALDGGETPVDVVFPLIHGPHGEDGTIQGMLELAGVPYVGAGVLGSALGMDKAAQKVMLQAAGITVVPWVTVYERDWTSDPDHVLAQAEALGYPLFVKPANLGSSVGISKVHDRSEFDAAVATAFRHDGKVVIEQGVQGAREIEVAVLGNDEPVASVPGEVVPSGEFYDYAAKYLDGASDLYIPAQLPADAATEIQQVAVGAFRAIDGAGMARVDFFYRSDPPLLAVNELNTIPGFTEISMYPKLWSASGLDYPSLLERLIDLAVERSEREANRGSA